MKKVIRLIVLFLMFSSIAIAQTSDGTVVLRDGKGYVVVVDHEKKDVKVYAHHFHGEPPKHFTVHLKKDGTVLESVRVKLKESSGGKHMYSGTLSPNQQSSVGVQFEISLP
ncbi:MAG: hypothetical protein AB7F43_13090 [Bacteriovoracia bacterium]